MACGSLSTGIQRNPTLLWQPHECPHSERMRPAGYWLWLAGLASVCAEGHGDCDFISAGLKALGLAFPGARKYQDVLQWFCYSL